MPAPSSPASSPDLPEKEASELDDAVHDEEQTDVMGRDELPDFQKNGGQEQVEKRPPQRPSTFTRLLLNPRR
jgi:hypothetical protein